MERKNDGLFHYNQWMWERTDRVQEYRGATIYTITSKIEVGSRRSTRFYEVVEEDRTWTMGINKRGGNIKAVKELIDMHKKEGNKNV